MCPHNDCSPIVGCVFYYSVSRNAECSSLFSELRCQRLSSPILWFKNSLLPTASDHPITTVHNDLFPEVAIDVLMEDDLGFDEEVVPQQQAPPPPKPVVARGRQAKSAAVAAAAAADDTHCLLSKCFEKRKPNARWCHGHNTLWENALKQADLSGIQGQKAKLLKEMQASPYPREAVPSKVLSSRTLGRQTSYAHEALKSKSPSSGQI